MRSPEDVKSDLIQLIRESQAVSPQLANRLDEMRRWIAQKKSGLLMRKRYVMQLLEELIADASVWLSLQQLSQEDKNTELAGLSTPERYWYRDLFPAWFNEKDPKLHIWKKNLMAGNFQGNDAAFINKICLGLENGGCETLNPFIADLSMATDLIASGTQKSPLCVQVTSVRDNLSTDKQVQWQETLEHWGIVRGLFISFNPSQVQVNAKVTLIIQLNSDLLPEQCYLKASVDNL
ncbi:hypothetical protein [Aliterella atlantica]|uniref:Uncharacterized protein n=1 Tax=Aliterella atlantica CENA595 TaxID=1618023 RepID=A0A0D9A0U0_9CYAN|nr:hypothetical protein [Aliterella atlantica]KJH73096.1 hypothetical protein UH38_03275 [Aliterella atlantica CENA595]